MSRFRRAPVPLQAPVVAGAVELGLGRAITPGIWSRPVTRRYSLRKAGAQDWRYHRMDETAMESWLYGNSEIGDADMVIREHVLEGGGYIDSLPFKFNSATYLAGFGLWACNRGVTRSDAFTKISAWASFAGSIACTLAQATSGNRPLYNDLDGLGIRYLTLNGGYMNGTFTKGSSFTTFGMGAMIAQLADAGTGATFACYTEGASSDRFYLNESSGTGVLRVSTVGGANLAATTNFIDGVPRFLLGDGDGGGHRVFVNGTEESPGDVAPFITRPDGQTLSIGIRFGSLTLPCNARMYSLVVGPKPTTDQRAHIRAFLGTVVGIAH